MRCYLTAILLLAGLTNRALAQDSAKDHCVVLISVDGLAQFYLDDPKAQLPTIRRLVQQGARSDGIVCSFPTNTWPNHTTLVTGVEPVKHGVLANNYLERASATSIALIPDAVFDKDEIVQSPTIYDVAHQAKLVTAGIVWPATRNARTLDWTVPDMFGDEAWPKYGTAKWLDELSKSGLPIERYGYWTKDAAGGVPRDWLATRLAAHLFENHPPNLLLVHLVEVDHVQHRHGPRSAEAYWSVSYADDRVRDIIEAAERSPRKGKTTYVIASDHGFFAVAHDIRINVLLSAEKMQTESEKRVAIVAQGGACMAYILDKDKETLTGQLKPLFEKVDGVQRVILPKDYAKLGLRTPTEDPRAPDLWLAAKEGYSFSDSKEGTEVVVKMANPNGTHGYLPDQPNMLGTLVMAGRGIKPGVKLGKSAAVDVAPTIAKLLGLSFPSAQGKPLLNALVK